MKFGLRGCGGEDWGCFWVENKNILERGGVGEMGGGADETLLTNRCSRSVGKRSSCALACVTPTFDCETCLTWLFFLSTPPTKARFLHLKS